MELTQPTCLIPSEDINIYLWGRLLCQAVETSFTKLNYLHFQYLLPSWNYDLIFFNTKWYWSNGKYWTQGTSRPSRNKGTRRTDVSYNRWGRKNCSGNATLVYTGGEKKHFMWMKNNLTRNDSRMLSFWFCLCCSFLTESKKWEARTGARCSWPELRSNSAVLKRDVAGDGESHFKYLNDIFRRVATVHFVLVDVLLFVRLFYLFSI